MPSGTSGYTKEVFFQLSKPDVTENGAALLELLLYPEVMLSPAGETFSKQEALCFRIHSAICAVEYWARFRSDPQWATSPQAIRPIHLSHSDTAIDTYLRGLPRRWRDRLIAGQMACTIIDYERTGRLPKGLESPHRLTIDSLCGFFCSAAGYDNDNNFENRVWRAARRIMHLCAAIHFERQAAEKSGKGPIGLHQLVADRVVIRQVIDRAREFEGTLSQSRVARVPSGSLKRLRLAA